MLKCSADIIEGHGIQFSIDFLWSVPIVVPRIKMYFSTSRLGLRLNFFLHPVLRKRSQLDSINDLTTNAMSTFFCENTLSLVNFKSLWHGIANIFSTMFLFRGQKFFRKLFWEAFFSFSQIYSFLSVICFWRAFDELQLSNATQFVIFGRLSVYFSCKQWGLFDTLAVICKRGELYPRSNHLPTFGNKEIHLENTSPGLELHVRRWGKVF